MPEKNKATKAKEAILGHNIKNGKPVGEGGRPPFEYTYDHGTRDFWKDCERFCMLQMTIKAIAEWFGTTVDTLDAAYKRKMEDETVSFSDFWRQNKQKGVSLLKNKAFNLAMKNDKTLLIFLLKNWGDMADVVKTVNDHHVVHDSSRLEQVVAELTEVLGDPG